MVIPAQAAQSGQSLCDIAWFEAFRYATIDGVKGSHAQTIYKFSFSRLQTRSKQQGTKDLLAMAVTGLSI
jgi:hypothetical protein